MARIHVYPVCYFFEPCWCSDERKRDDKYYRWVDFDLAYFGYI